MNKKNKLLISATAMLVLTGAAASASTFAWFTTVRSASVSYSSAHVYTDTGSLTVTYKSSLLTTWTDQTNNSTSTSLVLTGSHNITDISGDGIDFYKPIWNAYDTNSTTADSITHIATTTLGNADGYYIDFTLTIAQTNTSGNGMKVYLGSGTTIAPATIADPEDVAAVNSSRLAVVNADNTLKSLWAPEATDGSTYRYITEGVAGVDTILNLPTEVTDVTGYKYTNLTAVADADTLWTGPLSTYTTVAIADASNHFPAVATLTALAPSVDVTFRSWIEGTDPDCINTALAGIYNITLDLYGLAN